METFYWLFRDFTDFWGIFWQLTVDFSGKLNFLNFSNFEIFWIFTFLNFLNFENFWIFTFFRIELNWNCFWILFTDAISRRIAAFWPVPTSSATRVLEHWNTWKLTTNAFQVIPSRYELLIAFSCVNQLSGKWKRSWKIFKFQTSNLTDGVDSSMACRPGIAHLHT